jgi:hypothetical protein
VTHFIRLPRATALHRRLIRLSVLAILAAVCLSALLAAPAGAVVNEVEGTQVGLQPRTETLAEGEAETFGNATGSVIVDGATVYPIFWDPKAVYHTHHEWLTNISQFFQQMGAGSGDVGTMFGPLGQYRDRSNDPAAYKSVYMGSYSDTVKYPPPDCVDPAPLAVGAITCLTDAQVRAQLEAFITAHSLPTGMNSIYYVITPPGVAVCLDKAASRCSDFKVSASEESKGEHVSASYKQSFCSYHGAINTDHAVQGDGKTILYAAVPWTAGTLGMGSVSKNQLYAQGYFCQDGGWNPENNEEKREVAHEPSSAEQEILKGETGTAEEKLALEEKRRLEGPHQQEPNSEGKGEAGDYSAGLSDLIVNQIAEEQANVITDPLLTSWHDETGHEVTDLCRNVFASTANGPVQGSAGADEHTQAGTLSNQSIGAGRFYLNNTFNLATGGCSGGVGLLARFTAPNPVNANEIVGFDGIESTLSLLEGKLFGPTGPPVATFATFNWKFGDGAETTGYAPDSPTCEAPWLSPCAGSVFHSYVYGGTYHVTLTVTDIAGDVATVTHDVTVAGPPPPTPPAVSSPGSGSTGASTTGSGTTGGGSSGGGSKGSGTTIVTPVARAGVASHSLRTALRRGLAVTYSVNEQVAGHFEVLMSRALAKRLKIGGPAATGLPAGTPPQVVIATAVLVTT